MQTDDTRCLWQVNYIIGIRSEEHTSELQSQSNIVCRLLLEKKNVRRTHADCRRTRLLDARRTALVLSLCIRHICLMGSRSYTNLRLSPGARWTASVSKVDRT